MDDTSFTKLKEVIASKCAMKQDVYAESLKVFEELKGVLETLVGELKDTVCQNDQRIEVAYDSSGVYEAKLVVAGDTLLFHLHTNVFAFPESHFIHKSPYVMKDPDNGYCGIIHLYNFLTDSYRFNRMNDVGYLVGRIFVNRERHFFVEGQGKLGFLFRDFSQRTISSELLREVIIHALRYTIDFDLYTPPMQAVKEVSLSDMQALSHDLKLKTAKRLGFRFSSDNDDDVQF